ncbi:MAG: YbjN domain-containing protein [Ignavibacteria bacterium]|nr:YbjN domain-containing protein [Ignavibacteria bacterium]
MELLINKEKNNMIETPVELIQSTIDKVENYLKEIFPDYISFGNGSFTVNYGSSQIMIIVRPFTETETCVEIVSNVVTGADITPELMKFLLSKNSEIHFGAFGLLFDDTITFQHSIAGTNMDKNEFETSLKTVAIISDHYDDEIVKIAGGKRGIDLLGEEIE